MILFLHQGIFFLRSKEIGSELSRSSALFYFHKALVTVRTNSIFAMPGLELCSLKLRL
jgi:hypothetical protein